MQLARWTLAAKPGGISQGSMPELALTVQQLDPEYFFYNSIV